MIKKLLFPIFSIFLTFQSIKLVNSIYFSSIKEFNWIVIILFSIAINLFVTGIFAFLGFAFSTSKLLPDSYYKIKNAQMLSTLYQILGVKYFKMFLMVAFWGKEKNRKKYFNGSKSGVENFDYQTRQSEFGHLVAFIAILVISFMLLFKGYYTIFLATNTLNIIANFYPILLQRMHRVQIERVTEMLKSRSI